MSQCIIANPVAKADPRVAAVQAATVLTKYPPEIVKAVLGDLKRPGAAPLWPTAAELSEACRLKVKAKARAAAGATTEKQRAKIAQIEDARSHRAAKGDIGAQMAELGILWPYYIAVRRGDIDPGREPSAVWIRATFDSQRNRRELVRLILEGAPPYDDASILPRMKAGAKHLPEQIQGLAGFRASIAKLSAVMDGNELEIAKRLQASPEIFARA
jgi:hypothetical protein